MNIKVRLNTFETNSSSAHTCVLNRTRGPVDDTENEDFKIAIFEEIKGTDCFKSEDDFYIPIDNGVCFSRGFEILTDWRDRMAYIIADTDDISELKMITEVLKKRIKGCSGLRLYTYDDYISCMAGTNNNVPLLNPFDQYEVITSMLGGVDHQSRGTSRRCLEALAELDEYKEKTKLELIEEFIFGNKVLVIVDSDESSEFTDLVRYGLLDEDIELILTEKSKEEKVNGRTITTYFGVFVESEKWAGDSYYEDY